MLTSTRTRCWGYTDPQGVTCQRLYCCLFLRAERPSLKSQQAQFWVAGLDRVESILPFVPSQWWELHWWWTPQVTERSLVKTVTSENVAWSRASEAQGFPAAVAESSVSTSPTDKQGADILSISKVSQRTERLLVLYLSYFQTSYKRF